MPLLRGLAALPALLLCACPAGEPANTGPSVSISSHADGALVDEGQGIELVAAVSDDQDVPERLQVSWSVDGQQQCRASSARPDGTSRCSWVAVVGGGAVEVLVEDSAGSSATASIALEVRAANLTPTCEITAPEDGVGLTPSDTLTLTATVLDDDSPSVVVSSDQDGELGETTPDAEGAVSLEIGPLTVGAHSLTLLATDPQGASCSDSVGVVVGPEDTAAPEPDTAAPEPE